MTAAARSAAVKKQPLDRLHATLVRRRLGSLGTARQLASAYHGESGADQSWVLRLHLDEGAEEVPKEVDPTSTQWEGNVLLHDGLRTCRQDDEVLAQLGEAGWACGDGRLVLAKGVLLDAEPRAFGRRWELWERLAARPSLPPRHACLEGADGRLGRGASSRLPLGKRGAVHVVGDLEGSGVDCTGDLARRAKPLESNADGGGRSLHGGHGEPAPGLLELLAGAKGVEALVDHVVAGWVRPVPLVLEVLKRHLSTCQRVSKEGAAGHGGAGCDRVHSQVGKPDDGLLCEEPNVEIGKEESAGHHATETAALYFISREDRRAFSFSLLDFTVCRVCRNPMCISASEKGQIRKGSLPRAGAGADSSEQAEEALLGRGLAGDAIHRRRRESALALRRRRAALARHLAAVDLLVRLAHLQFRRVLRLPRQQLLHQLVGRRHLRLGHGPVGVDGERLERTGEAVARRGRRHQHPRQVCGRRAADRNVTLAEDRPARWPVVLEAGWAHDRVRHAAVAKDLLRLTLAVENAARVEPDDRNVRGAHQRFLLRLRPLRPRHAGRGEHHYARIRLARLLQSEWEFCHTLDVERHTLAREAGGAPDEAVRAGASLTGRGGGGVARERLRCLGGVPDQGPHDGLALQQLRHKEASRASRGAGYHDSARRGCR
eukprot:scaffold89202_cov69-Phaeocystis_antarctica.AAC.3